MPRAILRNGVICPLEALPGEWAEGQELRVESLVDEDDSRDIDDWLRDLERLVAENDPDDWRRVERTLQAADE